MPEDRLRTAQVGDLLPPSTVRRGGARVLDATAMLVPGVGSIDGYTAGLAAHAPDFAAWDGRFVVTESDGRLTHRLAIVDRYGQVYSLSDAASASQLPDAAEITDWFRYLSTACPECGVIDDPIGRGWTP